VSIGYVNAGVPSVCPSVVKSMTPFPGYSNRHESAATPMENRNIKATMKFIITTRIYFASKII